MPYALIPDTVPVVILESAWCPIFKVVNEVIPKGVFPDDPSSLYSSPRMICGETAVISIPSATVIFLVKVLPKFVVTVIWYEPRSIIVAKSVRVFTAPVSVFFIVTFAVVPAISTMNPLVL